MQNLIKETMKRRKTFFKKGMEVAASIKFALLESMCIHARHGQRPFSLHFLQRLFPSTLREVEEVAFPRCTNECHLRSIH